MKEEIQIIERNGKPEWAVLPYEEYLRLIEQAGCWSCHEMKALKTQVKHKVEPTEDLPALARK